MPRLFAFAITFMLLWPSLSITQDKDHNLHSFEGSEAADRKELVSAGGVRWCPAGSFQMGSPKTELGLNNTRNENENQASVTLTKGFWLCENEVTQGQWQTLMSTAPWKGKKYVKEGNDHVATFISYDDAVEFCHMMTNQDRNSDRLPQDWKYSLPTEAQWEYACRAGTTTKFGFGDDESKLGGYAWWGGIIGGGNTTSEQYAHEFGQKGPNAWGLKDMHGNVWEWCADMYTEKLQGGLDPVGTSTGSDRVNRGGSWGDDAADCRSARRDGDSPGLRNRYLGFRLAVVHE